MSDEHRRYMSYLLRLWQTEREGALVWCASLESPTTGKRQGFVGLKDLYVFLEQATAPLGRGEPRPVNSGSTNVPEPLATQAETCDAPSSRDAEPEYFASRRGPPWYRPWTTPARAPRR